MHPCREKLTPTQRAVTQGRRAKLECIYNGQKASSFAIHSTPAVIDTTCAPFAHTRSEHGPASPFRSYFAAGCNCNITARQPKSDRCNDAVTAVTASAISPQRVLQIMPTCISNHVERKLHVRSFFAPAFFDRGCRRSHSNSDPTAGRTDVSGVHGATNFSSAICVASCVASCTTACTGCRLRELRSFRSRIRRSDGQRDVPGRHADAERC